MLFRPAQSCSYWNLKIPSVSFFCIQQRILQSVKLKSSNFCWQSQDVESNLQLALFWYSHMRGTFMCESNFTCVPHVSACFLHPKISAQSPSSKIWTNQRSSFFTTHRNSNLWNCSACPSNFSCTISRRCVSVNPNAVAVSPNCIFSEYQVPNRAK